MKRTLIVLCLVLVFCLAGLGTAFADDGTYHGNNSASIIEDGVLVDYNTVYVNDDQRVISSNQDIKTKDIISVPEGVVDFVVANWQRDLDKNPTEYTQLQNGVFSIDSSQLIDYTDFYKVNKTYDSEKIVTIEERDGLLWIVTKWTTNVDEFTFRMTGDSQGVGQPDLLLFLVSSSELQNEERELSNTLIHPIEEVNDIPLFEPIENQTTSDENTPNVVSPESAPEVNFYEIPEVVASKANTYSGHGSVTSGEVAVIAATMKKSGLPILPMILILLLSGLSAIGIRRIKN